jgi:phosphohistidine phosphatase
VELVVVRHAIAYERDAFRWPDDRDRPLTPVGETKFRRAARGLARIAGPVDRVLSSPLVRAWRTAEILTEEAGWPAPMVFEALEPDRRAADVLAALMPHRLRDSVALVGHEPLLGELVSFLLTGSDAGGAFPLKKGAAASVAIDGDIPDGSSLQWLLTPKIERAIK